MIFPNMNLRKMFTNMWWNNFLIGLIVGIILIYGLIEIKNRCWLASDAKKERQKILSTILRGVGRWATASQGDKSPLISLLHANYSAGYLWAILDAFSSSEIEEISKQPFLKIRDEVTKTQDLATKKVIKACPNFAPPPSVLTKIAGEEV